MSNAQIKQILYTLPNSEPIVLDSVPAESMEYHSNCEEVRHDFIDNDGRRRVFTTEKLLTNTVIDRRYIDGVLENELTFRIAAGEEKPVQIHDIWYKDGEVAKDIKAEYTFNEFLSYCKSK